MLSTPEFRYHRAPRPKHPIIPIRRAERISPLVLSLVCSRPVLSNECATEVADTHTLQFASRTVKYEAFTTIVHNWLKDLKNW